jgi:hypothetical protein
MEAVCIEVLDVKSAVHHETPVAWAERFHPSELCAYAAGSPEARRILRNRVCYGVANNGCGCAVIQTPTNDVIGTAPGLQRLTENGEGHRRIGAELSRGCRPIESVEKLRFRTWTGCRSVTRSRSSTPTR